MKLCFRCGEEKPLSQFYKHPQMADGHLNKCKECTKRDASDHRLANLPKIMEYDRKRGQDPERKLANRENYKVRMSTAEGRRKEAERSKGWREENAIKRAAHIIAGNAIRGGRLIPLPCERCGTKKRIQAHHEDYGRPLEVNWLCTKHHGERHREINAERRAKAK